MHNKIKNEINNNKRYIYIAYLISIFTMLPQFVASMYSINTLKHTIYLFIVLIVLFLVSKFSKLLFGIFIIYINLTNIIIGHVFIHWGYTNANIGPRIEVSAISPRSETFEYLMTYIDYRDVLLGLYSFLILIALYKFIAHYMHSFKVLRFLGFVGATIIIIGVSFYRNPLISVEPFSIPNKCIEAKNHSKLYDLRKESIKGLSYSSDTNATMLYDKIIIIQGESVNKHHMSIYNYDKNTTPFLSSLKSEKNFYIFNAIAPTNQTRYSVPILHTKANVHDFEKLFLNSKSDVGKYRNYGYKTYWLSNQASAGAEDSSIASVAQEANIYFFENVDFEQAKPDKILISYLKNNKLNAHNELYVLHLMGSHARYTQRYTTKHVLFSEPIDVEEAYDNTIFYTDYILKNIFEYFLKKFPNDKILFVYISDHGEVIHKNKHGHGYLPPFKDEYDIPFVIYSNVENDRIDTLYQENKMEYFNLENLNYMIEYISGVKNDLNVSHSNKVFALKPTNIFNYDKLQFYKK